MADQYWSWVLTAIGLLGFYLAGKKVWWCWYVNIANQLIWLLYAFITEQWGFLVGVVAYTYIFVKNAIAWTVEHQDGDDSSTLVGFSHVWAKACKRRKKVQKAARIGVIDRVVEDEDRLKIQGHWVETVVKHMNLRSAKEFNNAKIEPYELKPWCEIYKAPWSCLLESLSHPQETMHELCGPCATRKINHNAQSTVFRSSPDSNR